jgi:hypothetical protein
MLTLGNAIKQAKEYGAVKYGEVYMHKDEIAKGNSEFKFIHFFDENNIEVGYYTFSLRDFKEHINVFEYGRVWSNIMFGDLINITKI